MPDLLSRIGKSRVDTGNYKIKLENDMVHPIADILNRLVNAQAVQKETVVLPFSQMKYAIAKILERKGFVKNVDFKGKRVKKTLEISLRYQEGVPRIIGVKRISKPGARMYGASQKLKRVRNGRGFAVISTSKGLMTDQEARTAHAGGEILCEVW